MSHLQRVVSLLTSTQENFEARALHPTHFGRLCPIETPEGTPIGLRKNLALPAEAKAEAGQKLSYLCELKIDGLKIVLTYRAGELLTAVTRGNGRVGEEVTANVRTIKTVPLVLTKPVDVIVEGEIWLAKKELVRLNQERKKTGEAEFANPRNVAAGTIRQLDPRVVADRHLDIFIYDIAKASFSLPVTQKEELELLQTLGFKVNKSWRAVDTTVNNKMIWICGNKGF